MKRLFLVLALFSIFVNLSVAQTGIRTVRVKFAKGSSGTVIRGAITGSDIIDYVVGAAAGQTMKVTLHGSNNANYFNVNPPGSEAAIFVGSTSGVTFEGSLPASGDYRVRVYLMRSAARRKETSRYTLSIAITGRGDAKVSGTPYHATGTVPCSVGTDPKGSNHCSFGVVRGGQGKAEVYLAEPGFDVTIHKDHVRVLRFTGNTVTSSDSSERVTAARESDNWLITVNDFYFYTIPDAVINGG